MVHCLRYGPLIPIVTLCLSECSESDGISPQRGVRGEEEGEERGRDKMREERREAERKGEKKPDPYARPSGCETRSSH